jgi:DNA-binding response OmpR family regulator
MEAGFNTYLIKPVDLDVLNHWLRAAVKRAG